MARGSEERVRFCHSCNAVIGWYAQFCEECGRSMSKAVDQAESKGRPDPRPGQPPTPVEKDLFRAHLRLIHRFMERAHDLGRGLDRVEQNLKSLDEGTAGAKKPPSLIGLAERLLELEQDWEDLQRAYNNESEILEEDFLERIDELEADLELSPPHQAAVEGEMKSFLAGLETLEERLRETGRLLDLVKSRSQSRVLALRPGRGPGLLLGLAAFGVSAGGGAYGVLVAGFPALPTVLTLVPSWIALSALLLAARDRAPA